MEQWDVYNKKKELTKKTAIRGQTKLQPGEFHKVVKFVVIRPDGKLLLTQRADFKEYGLYWECGGGSVKIAETSFEGAKREAEEEVGFKVDDNKAFILESHTYKDCFVDIWVFPQDVKKEEIRFPDGESIASKWVTMEEFDQMHKDGTYSPADVISKDIYNSAIKQISYLYPDYLK